MVLGPLYSKLVIDRYVPIISVLLGQLISIAGIAIGTYIGRHTVAGPIIQAFAMDLGTQTTQIANRTSIYSIEPKARNRINTAYMVSVFCGQIMGTAVGNRLYAQGGWVRSGTASVGFVGLGILITMARGPNEKGWVGWHGGWSLRRKDLKTTKQEPAVEEVLDELSAEDGKVINGGSKDGDDETLATAEIQQAGPGKEDSTATPNIPSEEIKEEV